MGNRRYLNFDLLLEDEGEGLYRARVTTTPLGDQQPSVSFRLPFDATTLENLLLKLDPGRSGMLGPGDPVTERAAIDFGGPLFEAIFTGDLAFVWRNSLQKALTEGANGLRLRLRLDEAPALAGLPWELLYDTRDQTFTAQYEGTPVVRLPSGWDEPQPMRVDGPLHVLAVISSPLGLEELDVEREWRRIKTALATKVDQGLVVVTRLPEATITGLGEWLRDNAAHILHFVGHGNFDPAVGEGVIYFQDEHGYKDPVTAAVLHPFIRAHDPLRMVVLNSCRSARNSPRDPYGGMAQGLVRRGAKAVVAMQFRISDVAAARFSEDFYGALTAGLPVDQAVTYARMTLQAKYGGEWAAPVLFMRSPDGNIFENVKAPPDWVPPSARVADPPVADPPVADPPVADPPVADPPVADPPVADPPVADPPVADPPVADPPVADPPVADPPTADPPTADPPTADPPTADPPTADPPTADPPTADPSTADPPHPPLPPVKSGIAAWVRAHSGLVWGAASFLVVVVAGVVAWRLLSGDSPPPPAERFENSEVVVAAGEGEGEGEGPFKDELDLYLVDVDRETSEQLTTDGQSLLPVLSPDRGSMVYVRRGDPWELRIVAADGSGDTALFGSEPPEECAKGASRPAWIPGSDDLVMRCEAEDESVTLVRVGTDGEDVQVLLRLPYPHPSPPPLSIGWVGDPTVSPDGDTVVFFGEPLRDEQLGEGSLYRLDLTSPAPPELLAEETADMWAFSDAMFSPTENMLAWRAKVPSQVKNADYDVFVATFDSGGLGVPDNISDDAPDADEDEARDQDPSFSPDGTSFIYGSLTESKQDLVVVQLEPLSNQETLDIDPEDLPEFRAVPSWSSGAEATE